MRKKRRVSIWMLPVIAIIGIIGYLTNLDVEPHQRKTNKRQIKSYSKTPNFNDTLEMQIVTDFDELQVTADKRLR